MNLNRRTSPLLIALIITVAGAAFGQTVENTPDGTRISASAESVIRVKPDLALFSISIATEAPSSQDAGARNAEETERVVSALRVALGTGGEFKTSGYWINPQYGGGAREANRITSYVARNSIEVSVTDLSIVSKVLDNARRAGANNIGSLRFTLAKPEEAKTTALVEATREAREKAAAMAKALGLRVRRVVSVTDTSAPNIGPLTMEPQMAAMRSREAQTPVEPGLIEVKSAVSVVIEAR